MPLSEVQLPLVMNPTHASKRANLSKYKKEISILDNAGVNRTTIAACAMLTVQPSIVFSTADDAPLNATLFTTKNVYYILIINMLQYTFFVVKKCCI